MDHEPVAAPAAQEDAPRGLTPVLAMVALGVGTAGFLFGTTQVGRPATPQAAAATPAPAADGALSYRELAGQRRGPNADWTSELGDALQPPDPLQPVQLQPGALPGTLRERARRRAYSGAPPVIPHAVDALSARDCLACHRDGVALGERTAPPVPHSPDLGNCTQCHAPPAPTFLQDGVQVESRFVGLGEQRGERAGIGAPPVIPHDTAIRSDCVACHGPLAPAGMRTSHPWRTNCKQCHAAAGGFSE